MREGQKRDLARSLRRDATETEKVFWGLLRSRRLDGIKFRRQVPVGPYVADFASIEHRLVIELDGSQHLDSPRDRRATIISRAKAGAFCDSGTTKR